MAASNIQVIFELGHTAFYQRNSQNDAMGGTTHDWVAFLRGPKESPNIGMFIRRVVFHLHSTFQQPLRVVDKPPFEVRESGYAGFMMPIEVHFEKSGDNQPQKIRFDYDLSLFPEASCNCLQTEKVTFQNPPFEFRRRLLDGGGNGLLENDVAALLPGRKLKQQFDHSRGRGLDRIPQAHGWSVPSFEEFAELFGLKIPSATVKQQRPAAPALEQPQTVSARTKPTPSSVSSKKVSIKPLPPLPASSSPLTKTKSSKTDDLLSTALSRGKSSTSDNSRVGQSSRDSPVDKSSKKVSHAAKGKSTPDATLSTPPANSGMASVSPASMKYSSVDALTSKIKAHTGGVPRTPMSPLSPAADDDDNANRSRSRSDDGSPLGQSDATRRGSAGFLLPTVNQKITTKDVPHLEQVNGKPLSEPSDDDSEPEVSRRSKLKEKTPNYRDVRIPDARPMSLSTDDDHDEPTGDPFSGTPPKVLSASEEDDRYRLQVLLSQLTDRTVIQSVVDVLDPLGAFIIDRKTRMFSFNLYMLDETTIGVIKKLTDFDQYIFEED